MIPQAPVFSYLRDLEAGLGGQQIVAGAARHEYLIRGQNAIGSRSQWAPNPLIRMISRSGLLRNVTPRENSASCSPGSPQVGDVHDRAAWGSGRRAAAAFQTDRNLGSSAQSFALVGVDSMTDLSLCRHQAE